MGAINVLKMIENLRNDILTKYASSQKFGKLAIIQIDNDPASELYIKSKKNELSKWGIEVCHVHFFTEDYIDYSLVEMKNDILDTIRVLNDDETVTGIILQLPIPKSLQLYEKVFIKAILPIKNVDGFFQGKHKTALFTPCTPKGIMYILKNQRDITGLTVCVIGRGKTIGKPLIDILSKEPCTLICCNSNTSRLNLAQLCGVSDVVISAVGQPGIINTGYLKDGTLVIDAGISYVDGKQTGDYIHYKYFDSDIYAGIDYTPRIGGVGKMTVAMLAVNIIEAFKLQQNLKKQRELKKGKLQNEH